MIRIRSFHQEEIKEYFKRKNLNQAWGRLVKTYPSFFTSIWEVSRSDLCKERARLYGWTPDECIKRLQEAILTIHWSLGDDLLNELLYLGRNPLLVSFMNIKETVIDKRNIEGPVDLQVVILLASLRAIAKQQCVENPSNFVLKLLMELHLEKSFLDKVMESGLEMDLLTFS